MRKAGEEEYWKKKTGDKGGSVENTISWAAKGKSGRERLCPLEILIRLPVIYISSMVTPYLFR